MICFHEIRLAMNANQSTNLGSVSCNQAVVALIVDGSQSEQDPKIVFIERALNENDPWSGQMAFPGGRCEPEDVGLLETACRETSEEIGLDLTSSETFGRLDDLQGRHGGRSKNIVISCYVFGARSIQAFSPNNEVAEIISVSMSELLAPEAKTTIKGGLGDQISPGICVGDGRRVIWGLTYRFLSQFFLLFGHTLSPE